MTHRAPIRGADLKGNASQHVGALNAEKCIVYLRGIGAEIDDATAEGWLDTQATHRFLRSEKAIWRRVELWSCRCGDMQGFSESGRGRMRLKPERPRRDKPAKCEKCNTGYCRCELVFAVRRDGTVMDLRRGADAVVPLRLDEWAGGL